MANENIEYSVRSIERALQILDCFDTRHGDLGLTEIAQRVGLHKATTHRIVATLLNRGYLDRIPRRSKIPPWPPPGQPGLACHQPDEPAPG